MIKGIVIALSTLAVFLVTLSCSVAADTSLRDTLEATWKNYLKASSSGKEAEFEKSMSSYRLGTMKNSLASARRSLTPDMIKSIAEHSPDISEAEFVNILENGPTAGLVYVRDSEEEDASGKPRVTFTFIKFVKEASGWKVDGVMNVGSPKFQDDGRSTEFDPTDLPPTYEIDGQVRTAPEPENPPDFAALLDVLSYGFRTEVTVNGVKQGEPVEASRSGMLEGGLRKGKNSIVIGVTRIDKDAPSAPRVAVRRVLEDRTTEEVFTFEPKDNTEGTHTLSFTIDH